MARKKFAMCEPMMCCLFDEGYTTTQIADVFGATRPTVIRRLKDKGYVFQGGNRPKSFCPALVLCMRNCGHSIYSISDVSGASKSAVYDMCRFLGLGDIGLSHEKKDRNDKIVEMSKSGLSANEIDRRLCICRGTSSSVLRMRGIDQSHMSNKQRHEKAKSFISDKVIDYFDGFEVVERTSKDTYSVRCGECGHEFRRCFDRKRKGAVTCPECEKARREAEWWAKPKRQMQIIFPAQPKKSTDPDEIIECVECGKRFRLGDTSFKQGRKPVCCSDRCKARRRNRFKHKDEKVTIFWRKVARHYGTMICYLCGIECDENDFTIVNGRKTIGDTYPTTDHVIPWFVSHDGSMENSRIACHRCNTMKHTMSLDEFCEMYGLEVSA